MGTFTYFFPILLSSEIGIPWNFYPKLCLPDAYSLWLLIKKQNFQRSVLFCCWTYRSITDKCFIFQLITGHWNGLSNSMASGHHLGRVGSEWVIGQSVRLDRFLGIFLTYSAPWTHLRTRPIPALGPSGLPSPHLLPIFLAPQFSLF